jgi:hypothetical protein
MSNGEAPIKIKGGSIVAELVEGLTWSGQGTVWSVDGTEGYGTLVDVEVSPNQNVRIPKPHARVTGSDRVEVEVSYSEQGGKGITTLTSSEPLSLTLNQRNVLSTDLTGTKTHTQLESVSWLLA